MSERDLELYKLALLRLAAMPDRMKVAMFDKAKKENDVKYDDQAMIVVLDELIDDATSRRDGIIKH